MHSCAVNSPSFRSAFTAGCSWPSPVAASSALTELRTSSALLPAPITSSALLPSPSTDELDRGEDGDALWRA